MQAQVEDGLRLNFAEFVGRVQSCGVEGFIDQSDQRTDIADGPITRHQFGAGDSGIGGFADKGDDFVDIGDGDCEAEQDMRAVAGLFQFEFGAARDDFFAEIDKGGEDAFQIQQFRAAIIERQHVDGEIALQRRMGEQLVQNHFGHRVAFDFDNHAHAVAVGFVAQFGNAFDDFFVDTFCDTLDQIFLVQLERNFGEDDCLAVFADFFELVFRAHRDAAAPGVGRRAASCGAEDNSACGEIGTGDDFQQFFYRDFGIFDEGQRRVDDFAEIMRRDVCRHADCYAAAAINEQIGEARRQNVGLLHRCRRNWDGNRRCLCRCLRASFRRLFPDALRCNASRRRYRRPSSRNCLARR